MTTGIDPLAIWIVIFAVAAGTFILRSCFILLFGWVGEIPPPLENALRFVPAAVLAGLAFPAFVSIDGAVVLSLGNERLVAGSVATIVAWRTENMLVTIAVGMVVLWVLVGIL